MTAFLIENIAPLMFCALVVVLLIGYPVSFALAAVGIGFGLVGIELGLLQPSLLQALPERIWGVMSNDTLLAVPFFTFMGLILERSGMAEDLLDTIGQLFGPLRGGLAYAVIFVGALLAVMVVAIGSQVFARYLFHQSLYWTEELGRHVMVWMIFLASVICVRRGHHLSITLLKERPKPDKQALMQLVGAIILAYFFYMMVVHGWTLTQKTMVQRSSAIHYPMGYVYAALPVSGLLMFIVNLEVMVKAAGWIKLRLDRLTPDQIQAMLGTEFGGMNEVLYNFYAITRKDEDLELAHRFDHERRARDTITCGEYAFARGGQCVRIHRDQFAPRQTHARIIGDECETRALSHREDHRIALDHVRRVRHFLDVQAARLVKTERRHTHTFDTAHVTVFVAKDTLERAAFVQ